MQSKYFIVVILILTCISFSPTLFNEYGLDDDLYLAQIRTIEQFIDLPVIFDIQFSKVDYRPIASLTFALEKLMIGTTDAHISHFINLFLYLLCIYILYIFLKSIIKNLFIVNISVTLFALIPLHASLLGNIKNRDNLLSYFFGMLFYYCFYQFLKKDQTIQKIIYLCIGVFSCFLSIFSKLDGLMFILLIPLLYIIIDQKINVKNLLRIFIIGILSFQFFQFAFNFWTDKKSEAVFNQNPELTSDPLIFTENPIIQYPELSYKLAYAIQTTFEYITFIFKPYHHFFYYGYDMLPVLPLFHPTIVLKGIFILLVLLSAVWMYRKNNIYTYGVLFFFISISYCINLIQPIAGIIADRYAFIASTGACIAVATIIYHLYIYVQNKKNLQYSLQKVSLFCIIGIIIFYTPFNFIRSNEWKNYYTLLEADMPHLTNRSYEANRIAMNTYIEESFEASDDYTKRELLEKGIQYANSALKIYTENYLPYEGLTLANYALGDYLTAKHSAYQTIAKFDTVLETTYRILNDIYTKENKTDSIEWTYFHINKAVPNNNEMILKYAEYTFKNGHPEKGLSFCDSILQIYPQQAGAFQAKGYLYFGLKDSLKGSENSIKAFELGIKDMILLDATGFYWWPRDQQKYESLKKYL